MDIYIYTHVYISVNSVLFSQFSASNLHESLFNKNPSSKHPQPSETSPIPPPFPVFFSPVFFCSLLKTRESSKQWFLNLGSARKAKDGRKKSWHKWFLMTGIKGEALGKVLIPFLRKSIPIVGGFSPPISKKYAQVNLGSSSQLTRGENKQLLGKTTT